jgi:hypothetical protein
MRIELECVFVGLIAALCCVVSYKIIHSSNLIKNKKRKSLLAFLNTSTVRNNILMCFVLGALIHYVIRESNITDMYCKKVCYDDQCFMVCPV